MRFSSAEAEKPAFLDEFLAGNSSDSEPEDTDHEHHHHGHDHNSSHTNGHAIASSPKLNGTTQRRK